MGKGGGSLSVGPMPLMPEWFRDEGGFVPIAPG